MAKYYSEKITRDAIVTGDVESIVMGDVESSSDAFLDQLDKQKSKRKAKR